MQAANSFTTCRKIRDNENGILIADDICGKCSVYWLCGLGKAAKEIYNAMYEIQSINDGDVGLCDALGLA